MSRLIKKVDEQEINDALMTIDAQMTDCRVGQTSALDTVAQMTSMISGWITNLTYYNSRVAYYIEYLRELKKLLPQG